MYFRVQKDEKYIEQLILKNNQMTNSFRNKQKSLNISFLIELKDQSFINKTLNITN